MLELSMPGCNFYVARETVASENKSFRYNIKPQ
jgi:hypothetical protein